MAPRAVLEDTARRFIAAYDTWTLDAFRSMRSDDCVNIVLPASLGVPEMDNKQFLAFVGQTLDVIQNFRLQLLSMLIDAEQNRCALHVKGTGNSDLGPYLGEYVITLTMTEDGAKIKRFEEFVDSKAAEAQVPPLLKLAEERKRRDQEAKEAAARDGGNAEP